MKIFHISDLHLAENYKKSNFDRTHFLLEQISDEGFGHLIISGDITENADTSSFELARNLLKKFSLLDSSKTTVVIGNHDIYGGVHLAEDVIHFPAKCKAANYLKKVNEFEYYFREAFVNTVSPDKNTFFPFIKEFDDFILIGLNSIAEYSIIKNPFASNGEISKHQLKEIEKIISHKSYKNKIKIAVTHHHFCKEQEIDENNTGSLWNAIERQTMKLKGKKSLINQFNKLGIELVMHGHLHETNEYKRKGIKFINSGGSILGNKLNEIRISEINIDTSKIINKIRSFPAEKVNSIQKELSLTKEFYKFLNTPKEICLN